MRALAPIALVLLLLAAGPARADETHSQTFLIGERALGMGGAATGVGDEPAAVLYNPAGIALLTADAVGGNLSINAFDEREIEGGYSTPIGQRDLVARSRPGVPLFATMVKRFGPRDANRVRRHALAFSTLNPVQRRLRYDVDVLNEATNVRETLSIDHDDRITYFGPSVGFRLRDDLAVGLSAFLATRRLRHREDQIVVTEIRFDPDTGTFVNDTLSVRESVASLTTRHALFRLGVAWEPSARWRLGLMFQPPGIELTDSARLQDRRSFADTLASPAYATYFNADQGGLPAASPIPWELRIGASWAATPALLFAADVSLYGRSGGPDEPIRPFGTPEPDPETGDLPQAGDYLATSWYRQYNVNVSVGMEGVIAGRVPVRLGFFTDRSSAPPIEGPTDRYRIEHVDRYGATASVGYRSDDY
ncbi:MAG TPA: hypothetical protein RMH80_34520, partial [Polyangiaceae bacterium LLY-WYZ-15_(1-7)]|nr:hypothetical protein [Polyangiaceae bacterium LLY-WYZ-15_(1-7)]